MSGKRPTRRSRRLSPRLRRRIIFLLTAALVLWIGFFDSHSLYRRWRLHLETERLVRENAELAAEIDRLESELDRELSDEEIERIAREQYGMRKEGETVYPIQE